MDDLTRPGQYQHHGEPVTTVIYPDGVHILNNVWNVARPLVADWLADNL